MEVNTPVLVGLLIGSILLAFILSACSAKVFTRGKNDKNTPESTETGRKSLHNAETGQSHYIQRSPLQTMYLPPTRYFAGNAAAIMAARHNLNRSPNKLIPVKTGYKPTTWQQSYRSTNSSSPVSTISGTQTSYSSNLDLSSNSTSKGSCSSRDYPPNWIPKNFKNMPPAGINFYANVPTVRAGEH